MENLERDDLCLMIHTMSLHHQISIKLYKQIKDDLYNTKGTRLYLRVDIKKKTVTHSELVTHYYSSQGIGTLVLTETIKPGVNYHSIEIEKFNPSKLLGKDNRNDLMQQADILQVHNKFTELVQSINSKLPEFISWKPKRIDYSVNIITPDVALYIELFQRCNQPNKYYKAPKSKIDYKRRQLDNSLYLITKGFSLNFYNKEEEVIASGYDQKQIDDAKDILRIEVQCEKSKIYNLKKNNDDIISTELFNFIGLDLAREVLTDYYDKTIGSGDYYSLNEAKKIINAQLDITDSMKKKLIDHLKYINNYKSIYEAKKALKNNPLFNDYLKRIRALNINPVIIPRSKKIPFLANIKTKMITALDPKKS